MRVAPEPSMCGWSSLTVVQSEATSSNSLQKANPCNGRISSVSRGKVVGAIQNGPRSPVDQTGSLVSDYVVATGGSDIGVIELMSPEIAPARAACEPAFPVI